MKSPVNHSVSAEIITSLSEKDEVLAQLIRERGNIKIPVFEDPFYSLVMSIVYQQLSFRAAETIFNRLLERVGQDVRPEILSALEVEDYRSLGVSRQKANYILDICRHFNEYPERFSALHEMQDEAVVEALCEIKGVGRWTAQMFLMFTLIRPDVFPIGDLGIRKAISQLYDLPVDAPLPEFEKLAESWAPYRSYACHYLWHMNDQ